MANIFSGFADLFTVDSLTQSVINSPYVPSQIRDSGLFAAESIATTTVKLESDGITIGLVEASPRGSQGQVVAAQNNRTIVPFAVPHYAQYGTLLADSVQGIREFGSTTMTKTIQNEINKRLLVMKRQIDYTVEAQMLDAIRGLYRDSNGVTTSLFTAFGKKQKTLTIDLTSSTLDLRVEMMKVIEAMEAELAGIYFTQPLICYGATKWRQLLANADLKAAYRNWEASGNLTKDGRMPFEYGGVYHERYRPSSLVKIADDEAYAIPMGVSQMFKMFYAPADYMETVNTLGQPYYSKSELMDFGKGVNLECQSNVFCINALPNAVIKVK